MTERAIDIGSDRQLFVDDFLVAQMRGARRVLREPVRREWSLRSEHPWERYLTMHVQQFEDGGRYRMYYGCAAGDPDGSTHRRMGAMAESDDGIVWTKPSLGVVEFEGSADNNLVWNGLQDSFAPFKDSNPAAGGGEKYKAIVRGLRGEYGRPCLLAASSPDGLHWSLMSEEPVLGGGPFDTHNVAFFDTWRGEYVAYARSVHGTGPFQGGVRWIRRSTSADLLNWTPWEQIDCGDTPEEHLYTSACVQYERAPGVYLMFPSRFVPDRSPNPDWPHPGISDVVFMSSRDGLKFDRGFMEAFIRPGSDPDNWHERSLYLNRGILHTSPTEMSLYGREHSALPSVHYRRFTLRTDGFVSIKGGYDGGEMVTRPVVFQGSRLELNYSTSAVGSVRVELQDREGRPIPGYTLEDCPELFADEIDGEVSWSGGTDVGSLSGKPVRLRFALKDADMYAFRFTDGG